MTTKTVPSTKTETAAIINVIDIYNATIKDAEVSKHVLHACYAFAQKKAENLANGNEPFQATRRAANWTLNRFEGFDDSTEEEIRDLERLLDAQVQVSKPAPTPKPKSSAVTVKIAMKMFASARDNNLEKGMDPFEATRRAANWLWTRTSVLDQLATDAEHSELEQLLEAAVQAVKPAVDNRPPVSWETVCGDVAKIQTRLQMACQGIDIRKPAEPRLTVTETPITWAERQIKAIKAEIKQVARDIADSAPSNDEEATEATARLKQLDVLKTRLQETTAERERLLAEARAKKAAAKTEAAKKGKKAPEPAPKQTKEQKAAAKAAAAQGQKRAA